MSLRLVKNSQSPLYELEQRTLDVADCSVSENTRRAYASAWERFESWAKASNLQFMPADPFTLAMYLVSMADNGLGLSSIGTARAAVAYRHYRAGIKFDLESSALCDVMSGLSRKIGRAPKLQKSALLVDDVRRIVQAMPNDMRGARDRCAVLLGWHGAYRRSELCSISVQDVDVDGDCLRIRTGKSKTDQYGDGYEKTLPAAQDKTCCPVEAYKQWIKMSGITSGPVLRSVSKSGEVSRCQITEAGIVYALKAACDAAGIDSANVAGHSLRSGFATSAANAGVDAIRIAEQTGHKRLETLQKYVRRAKSAQGIGLV